MLPADRNMRVTSFVVPIHLANDGRRAKPDGAVVDRSMVISSDDRKIALAFIASACDF
jgi:hypothetical protein